MKNKTAILAAALLGLAAAHSSARERLAEHALVERELAEVGDAIEDQDADWEHGETSISALAPEARRARLGVLAGPAAAAPSRPTYQIDGSRPVGQGTFDWRDVEGTSFVTPVKDQGACGSCWAFAATAALEAYTMRTRGKALSLSEQTLVSCSNAGSCRGGFPNLAADYIQRIGLPQALAFPYAAKNLRCDLEAIQSTSTSRVGQWVRVAPDLASVKAALREHGPLTATLAVYNDFYYYVSGVYTHVTGDFIGYHVVLIVGYDDDAEAFTVKNSWGTQWGEEGYFRIAYSEMDGDSKFGAELWPGYGFMAFAPADASPVHLAVDSTRPSARGVVTVSGSVSIDEDTTLDGVSARVDSGDFFPISPSPSWTVPVTGEHTLTVRAVDNAGNGATTTLDIASPISDVTQPEPPPVGCGWQSGFVIGPVPQPLEGCAPDRAGAEATHPDYPQYVYTCVCP